ncbi:MAG TPA: outer membrane protein assembly factor BamD [Candidatus Eisenbacteria bacterium]|nr:outer membrane protein assembly factor BamD [Candidatus Eisenbacteria bacterium]
MSAPPTSGPAPRARRAAPALLIALLAAALAGCAAGTMPAVHSEAERLSLGRQALANKQYNIAVELLKGYVQNNAGGAEVDHAIELLGEAYLKLREWTDAQAQFERVTRDFPESDSAGSAAWRLGEAMWGQSRGPDFDQENTRKALAQWQTYLRDYPGHWANALAQARVAQARTRLADQYVDHARLYLKNGILGPARMWFQRTIDEYGDTPRRADAELGLATVMAKQGHRSDALAALRAVETQYPGTATAHEAAEQRHHLEHDD